uniref:RING-type domain-containing protein n=1 Tax=viral metagenome TaxID=1070528 RepID=A0A6C0KRK1_9ZZZZ
MSKKAKNIVIDPSAAISAEPELCNVCANKYTSVIRKKISCKFCKESACSKCIEQYLLSKHEDAHCLHCRVNYTDATLQEICTKTFLQQTYFKHRQEVLINRERASLPPLQDVALREKRERERALMIQEIHKDIAELKKTEDKIAAEYTRSYVAYYGPNAVRTEEGLEIISKRFNELEAIRKEIREKGNMAYDIRWEHRGADRSEEKKEEEEKKKFIRRCTHDGCQGFLSTAWKCGLCEWYSCSKCFMVKGDTHDAVHECKKEDIETAELIKSDCKPCPKCGEFIQKSSGCDQMYCISCNTPWNWITGKIVTSGPIHNPHYYEWMKRTGGVMPRNPMDVPCGGFPNAWELVRFPRGLKKEVSNRFLEFHRICIELQEISTRQYRSHMDQETTASIHVKFLLGDMDEKKWGQSLATNEKKRKRDAELQEIFGAFRMVAVELINRVQNFQDGPIRNITLLPIPQLENFLADLDKEIQALITMINDALLGVSKSYNYAVPCIDHSVDHHAIRYYRIRTQHHTDEVKKQAAVHSVAAASSEAAQSAMMDDESDTDVEELQQALAASFRSKIIQ